MIRFTIQGSFKSEYISFPIYDDCGPLAGAGVVDDYGNIQCFVASNSYPMALEITTGEPFYFTPTINDEHIEQAVFSLGKKNEASVKVEVSCHSPTSL